MTIIKIFPKNGEKKKKKKNKLPTPPLSEKLACPPPPPHHCFDPKMPILSFSCSFWPFCPNCPPPTGRPQLGNPECKLR